MMYDEKMHLLVRQDLGVEDARNGQGKAGQPDECDGNSGDGFTHPGSQWVNDGDISIIIKKNHKYHRSYGFNTGI